MRKMYLMPRIFCSVLVRVGRSNAGFRKRLQRTVWGDGEGPGLSWHLHAVLSWFALADHDGRRWRRQTESVGLLFSCCPMLTAASGSLDTGLTSRFKPKRKGA